MRPLSDEQLVARLRAGDDDALATVHERYSERLVAYVRRMSGAVDAEDVVQDVFARAMTALRCDDRPMTLRPWLYRVAHNRCLDVLRRPSALSLDELEASDAAHGITTSAFGHAAASAAEVAVGRERLHQVVADIEALPDQQRSALIIRELEGLSYEDLATALDTTVPAIKSLLVRARMNLARAAEAREAAWAPEQRGARRAAAGLAPA